MTELPFQPATTLNTRQNRALALAGVFQATQLTHMTALSGQQSIGENGNTKHLTIYGNKWKTRPVKQFVNNNITVGEYNKGS